MRTWAGTAEMKPTSLLLFATRTYTKSFTVSRRKVLSGKDRTGAMVSMIRWVLTPQCHSLIQPGGCNAQPMNSGLRLNNIWWYFWYFMILWSLMKDNDNCSLASPPVVESEHVVIVLDVILIEQHVNLTNKCLLAIIYNLAIPPLWAPRDRPGAGCPIWNHLGDYMALAEPVKIFLSHWKRQECFVLVVDLLCRNILADALIGGDHLLQGGHLDVFMRSPC